MSVKDRRKALGWDRATLAARCVLDKRVVQLIELGEWTEEGALGRVAYVLESAEAGDLDVQLAPEELPEKAAVLGGEV